MGGVDDEERVDLAQLLHQGVADGVDADFAGQHPGLRHEAMRGAEVEDFLFQAGDGTRLHVGDDDVMGALAGGVGFSAEFVRGGGRLGLGRGGAL